MATATSSTKTSKQLSGFGFVLFGLPFFVAGIYVAYLYFSPLVRWSAGRSWVEVPCRIESAHLTSGSKGSSRAIATYRYRYEGHEYYCDRVSFWGGSDNIGGFQGDAYRELESYRASKKPFRCFVDPSQPSQSVLYRTLRWEMLVCMSVFALTFPAVGAGVLAGGWIAMIQSRKEARHREQAPEEPWKWKTAWTESAIPEDASSWETALHAYTLWSGLIIFPMLAAMAVDHAFGRGMSLLVLIFPALWCLPAWFSLKRLLHLNAVGKTRLELAAPPVQPGGVLRGNLLLARPLSSRAVVDFTLVCEKSVATRSTSNRSSTLTEKIWSHKESVPADQLQRDASGFRLPVSIALPADAPESSSQDSAGEPTIAWKLEYAVPGTAIDSKFLIPVFHTGDKLVSVAETSAPLMEETVRGELDELLADCKIGVSFSAAGLPHSIDCPPARFFRPILYLVVFGTVWITMCVLIAKIAPLLFALVFFAAAAFIWTQAISMMFHQRTVDFSGTGLEIKNRFGPLRWVRSVPKSQILNFTQNSNMSFGSRRYYRVQLESVTGWKGTLVDGIVGESTAVAMKERLEEWKRQ